MTTEIKWSDPFSISPTELNPEFSSPEISLFPNPANNYAYIYPDKVFQDKIVDLEILNSSGARIYFQKYFSMENIGWIFLLMIREFIL